MVRTRLEAGKVTCTREAYAHKYIRCQQHLTTAGNDMQRMYKELQQIKDHPEEAGPVQNVMVEVLLVVVVAVAVVVVICRSRMDTSAFCTRTRAPTYTHLAPLGAHACAHQHP